MNNITYPYGDASDLTLMSRDFMRTANTDTPTLPILPDGDMPITPDNAISTLPMVPDNGTSTGSGIITPISPIAPDKVIKPDSGNISVPSFPIAPDAGRPIASDPNCQTNCSIFPGIVIPIPSTGTAKVRFLHAATNTMPCNIAIDARTYATNLSYSESTDYNSVSDGFRTVTVMSARSPRSILLRKNISFRNGENITIIIVNAINGIDLLVVSDTICAGLSRNLACLRMVNASFNSAPMDMILYDGRVVFSDVHYKEVTSFRRVRPGEYGFYITSTPYTTSNVLGNNVDIETMESMPISISDNYIPGYGEMRPLVSYYQVFRPSMMYTTYVLGDGTASYPYSVLTLETAR